MLNFTLRKNGLPMINIKNKEKAGYYGALGAGHKADLKPMVELIIKYLEETEDKIYSAVLSPENHACYRNKHSSYYNR